MTLQNFEQRQPDHELKKGMAYFKAKHVIQLKETAPGQWKATVRGSKNYTVEISLEGAELLEVGCDCPVGSPYCKHVIAVLYALRKKTGKGTKPGSAKKITKALNDIPDKDLRALLLKYSDEEEGFRKMAEAYVLAKEEEREKAFSEMLIRKAAQAVTESYGGSKRIVFPG